MSGKVYVFFTVMPSDAKQCCELLKYYDPTMFGAGKSYIGLRESPEDAVVRAKQVYQDYFDPKTFVMLEITFTTFGIAHYTMQCAGQNFSFAPMLQKQTYSKDDPQDYKDWHFHGKLLLSECDEDGNHLITSKWVDVP